MQGPLAPSDRHHHRGKEKKEQPHHVRPLFGGQLLRLPQRLAELGPFFQDPLKLQAGQAPAVVSLPIRAASYASRRGAAAALIVPEGPRLPPVWWLVSPKPAQASVPGPESQAALPATGSTTPAIEENTEKLPRPCSHQRPALIARHYEPSQFPAWPGPCDHTF